MDARNIQREDDFFEKREDYPVDNEKEKSKRDDDERESENLEYGAHEGVEKPENHASYEIELPSSGGDHLRYQVGYEEENERIRGDRKEQSHGRWVSGRKSS